MMLPAKNLAFVRGRNASESAIEYYTGNIQYTEFKTKILCLDHECSSWLPTTSKVNIFTRPELLSSFCGMLRRVYPFSPPVIEPWADLSQLMSEFSGPWIVNENHPFLFPTEIGDTSFLSKDYEYSNEHIKQKTRRHNLLDSLPNAQNPIRWDHSPKPYSS